MDDNVQQQPTLYIDTSGRPTAVWAGASSRYARPQIWRRIRRDDGTWMPIRCMTVNPYGCYIMPRTVWRQWMPVGFPLGVLYDRYEFEGGMRQQWTFYTGSPDNNLPSVTWANPGVPHNWAFDAPPDGCGFTDANQDYVQIEIEPAERAQLFYVQYAAALGDEYGGDAELWVRPDDYVEGYPPVVARAGRRDTINAYRVIFKERANDYNRAVVERQDDWSVIETGKRIREVHAPSICDPVVADRVASHLLMQNSFVGRGVTLTVGPKTALLVPPASVVMWEDRDFSEYPIRLRVATMEEEKRGVYRMKCVEEP